MFQKDTIKPAPHELKSGVEHLGRVLSVNPCPEVELKSVDFDLAACTAMNWRMGATLFEALQGRGIEDHFSPGALDQLHGAYLTTIMRNRVLRSRVVDVLKLLVAEGLHPMILKGGIQLLLTPAGGECSRYMEDVDILVPPIEYDLAESVVRREGFVAFSQHGPANHHGPKLRDRETGIEIEIHRRPLKKERPEYVNGLSEEVLKIATDDGLRIAVPSPRYRLLHNMIHSQESHANFALGTADLRHLFEFAEQFATQGNQLDWPWLVSFSAKLGLRPHLYAWAYTAHRIFGMPFKPDAPTSWIERNQFTRVYRSENRSRFGRFADQIIHLHVLAAQGGMGCEEFYENYRYWGRRLIHGKW